MFRDLIDFYQSNTDENSYVDMYLLLWEVLKFTDKFGFVWKGNNVECWIWVYIQRFIVETNPAIISENFQKLRGEQDFVYHDFGLESLMKGL